jgi:iron complex transport system ATP-binding protein
MKPDAAPLACEALTLRLGGRVVVDDVSLSLRSGQWAAIVGPNGAGKSSLLALLAGLREPDGGQVRLHGRRLSDVPARERAQALAWLAQQEQGGAEAEMAAIDIVRLGRLPHHGLIGAPTAADEAAVQRSLEETEALAVQAGVLLLDEPTTHLDAPHQRALLRGLAARARDGASVAAVLHDLTLALAADRVVVMAAGRVVADGAPADAALRAALQAVFDEAFTIEPVQRGGHTRWVAVPSWPA